jgi:thiamine biosynthesis lipoprotein
MKHQPRFFVALLALTGLVSCTSSTASWANSDSVYSMTATVTLLFNLPSGGTTTSSGLSGSALMSQIKELYTNYDAWADNTIAHEIGNNVYTINHTNDPVKVSPELYDLLSFSWTMKEATSGYFNPLVGSLSDLWKTDLFGSSDVVSTQTASSTSAFVPKIPSDDEIQAELTKMAASSLVFDSVNSTVQRLGSAMIDLGGCAKGYVTQKAVDLLKANGVSQYFINAGTSSIAWGENIANNGNFVLGFSDLPGHTYTTKNDVITTSAIERQYQVVDGKLYSHIVNPLTGSALVDWHGVVLDSADAGIADALSTIFLFLGPNNVDAYLSQYKVKALFYHSAKVYNEVFAKTDGVDELVNKGLSVQ